MDFLNSFAPATGSLSAIDVVLNLVLAFVLGVTVALAYRVTNRDRSMNQSLMLTMVILSMVVAMVMMVIGNSIARAFSLVGALSIIRFRTVVKDNRDIAFVFFSLAGGMAAGIGNYPIAIYGVGVICLMLLILDFGKFGASAHNVYLLRMQTVPTDMSESMFLTIFDEVFASHNRLATKTVRMGQYVEYSFLVRMKSGMTEQQVISRLSAIEGMERVSLIAESSEAEA